MSVDWPILTLGDVCETITDGAHNSPKSVVGGKPMASVKDLTRFGVDLSKARLIAVGEFDKLVKQGCQPEVGDVLIAKDGNSALDTVCTVDEPLDAVMLSSVAILRPDKTKLDADFLKYYFNSKQVIDYLKGNFISGAAIPRVVLKDFRRAEIKVPPLDVQKDISKKLRMLDDKIELNRETNQTLEHMAQAIFKSWFVDFEPTRAKIAAKEEWAKRSMTAKAGASDDHIKASQAEAIFVERAAMAAISGRATDSTNDSDAGALAGLDQLNPEQIQQLKTTAALFPDALVDSELGEIPLGWEVKLNGDVMDVRDGTHDSPKQSEVGFPLVTSKHITSGVLDIKSAYLISKEDYESVNKRSKVNQGDILLTMIGTVGMSYLVMQSDVNFAIKNVALFRTSEHKELKNYFYLLLKSPLMKEYLDARMAGTTQKYLSLKTLRSIDMLMPTAALLDAFNNITNPLLDKVFAALEENEYLSSIRGSLLPKLLAGELKAT